MMLATTTGMASPGSVDLEQVFDHRLSTNPLKRKEYEDFRDRAAYMYVTGTFPTHLRSFFTSLLRAASRYTSDPTALDQRSGHFAVRPDVSERLQLEHHPMVRQVRDYLRQGYRIQTSRSTTERRPFSKVFMYLQKGRLVHDKVVVQSDGSVLHGWGD